MLYIPDDEIDRLIKEDVPYGDLTSRSLGLGPGPARIDFRAVADMVVSSTEEAARILDRLGCKTELVVSSGAVLKKGETILTGTGSGERILAAWKVAQTLVEYASGIASAAARIVGAANAANPGIVVACTRKNFPGAKAISIKAILAGGAVPHRLGLSDTLLLFPEHLALLEGLSMADAIARLKAGCPEKKIVIEVGSLDSAVQAARAGADVVQLEKFSPEKVALAVGALSSFAAKVAAAGGVNAANAEAYASAGAHILVTSAPYSAPPMDVKVDIKRE